MTTPLPPFDWDIFCCVVDNFGDIGVTWRLARQLKREGNIAAHGNEVQVRLWVDDLASFARICPGLDPAQDGQWVDGIYIQHWHETLPSDMTPAKVVIEAFACELPAPFIELMASQPSPPCWINLEYLSAESWVEDCHGLASPQRVGNQSLNKYFFFPGFTAKTGGLLCERDLIAERELWQQDDAGLAAYWASLGLPPKQENELRVSLFTYESDALKSLVESWCQSATPVTLLLPLGRSLNDVLTGAGLADAIPAAQAGDLLHSGNLTIKLLPMTDQAGYDRLLWSCDLNLVRGRTPSCGPSGPLALSSGTSTNRRRRPIWSSWSSSSTTILLICLSIAANGCAASIWLSTVAKIAAHFGANGPDIAPFGSNMGEAGHRSCSGMGISSRGW